MIARQIAVILICSLMLGAIVSLVAGRMDSSKHYSLVKVDIAADGNQPDINLITSILSQTDSVKSVCSFEIKDKEQAENDIADAKADAAVILGEDFYDDVNNGVNTPVTIILGKRLRIGTETFKELARDGVSYIRTTEAAVYAADDTAAAYSMNIDTAKLQDAVSDIFISAVMNRGALFDAEVLLPFGKIGQNGYYASSFVTLFLLFLGFGFRYMYRKDGRAVDERLRMYGIRSLQNTAAKITVMTTILFSFSFIVMAIMCISGMTVRVGLLEQGKRYFIVRQIFMMLIPSFSMACFLHMIYSGGRRDKNAIVLLFLLDIFMIVSSGVIVPISFLPDITARAGSIMPLRYWFLGISQILSGRLDVSTVAIQCAFGIAFAVAGEVFLWKNL